MPQVKGGATWVTNVRQEAPIRRLWNDQTRTRMQNEKIGAALAEKLDSLSLKQHHQLEGTRRELREVKGDANRWQAMRRTLQKRSQSAITRPLTFPSANNVNCPHRCHEDLKWQQKESKVSFEETVYDILGSKNVQPSIENGDYRDAFNYKQSQFELNVKHPNVSSSLQKHPHGEKKGAMGKTSRKSSASGRLGSVSQCGAFWGDFSDTLLPCAPRQCLSAKARPKTAPGSQYVSLRRTSRSATSRSFPGTSAAASFVELKGLSHINEGSGDPKSLKKKEQERLLKLKQQGQSEQLHLQTKISMFYRELEQFKRRSHVALRGHTDFNQLQE